MKRVISVSRTTHIRAFYSEWFLKRLKEGFAGYVNPFGGRKHLVSLKPECVRCFVFWSKKYAPFLQALDIIDDIQFMEDVYVPSLGRNGEDADSGFWGEDYYPNFTPNEKRRIVTQPHHSVLIEKNRCMNGAEGGI